MKSSRFSCLIACGLLALSILSTPPGTIASAGPIVWGLEQNITGDSDVSTNGTLLYAYNFGRVSVASTTVNGVTFAPFVVPDFQTSGTVGSVAITESLDYLYGYDLEGSGTTPFSDLSSAYKAMLNSAASAGAPATITLDLGGLTLGHSYEFQWWANNSSTGNNWFVTYASAGNAVSVVANTLGIFAFQPGVDGGIGQFAIGTFTADNTSYSIAFNGLGNYYPLINGFQLRTVAVPEPSTYAMAMAGIACGGFTMWRRRKRV